MSDARDAILASIRKNNAAAALAESGYETVPRAYRAGGAAKDRAAVMALFEERLMDYDAIVVHADEAGTAAAVRGVLASLGATRVLVSADFVVDGIADTDVTWLRDAGLSFADLEQCDAVLTTSTLGIAETGTLVLQNAVGQGRRALSLLPDVHVCVVRASTVTATVPEAFARLAPTATLPTTFVSGPSATADIEMTRVKGVHGPRFLHVVLVDDEAGNKA